MKKFNWAILKEALHGSHRDFTQGSINLAIFLLAIPMIMEMVMESVFAIVDMYFVAKLGHDSVAVVVFTESMMAIIYAMAIGISIAATATVARRTGENDPKGAARAAAHVLYIGAAFSLLLSTIGILFAPQLLKILGASPDVIREGTGFTRVMLGGNFVVVFLFLLNAIFRGVGDASVAMKVLFWANVCNIVLSPCFVFGPDIFKTVGIAAPQWLINVWPFPHLGVLGAAVGTTIGRGVGALIALSLLMKKNGRITLHRDDWHFDKSILSGLVKIAAPAILQMTVATASWSVLITVVSHFGSEAVAGYGIGMRVIMFVLLPAMGLSNAAATLVGQNLGAGRADRAEASVWRAAYINIAFLGSTGLLISIFSHSIVGIFTSEPAVVAFGTQALHTVAFGFIFYALGMVLGAAFNGAGDTWTPTYLNLFAFWILEIPLANALAKHFEWGPSGVFWAITIAFSVLAVASAIMFKRGNWKRTAV